MNPYPQLERLASEAIDFLERGEFFAAVEFLARAEPRLATEAYSGAQLDLYWKRKALASMICFSRAGIQHGLTMGLASSPETAQALRSSAKGLAYNLASFTWPGWDGPGIVITAADIAIGLDAARLNLRLAHEGERLLGAWRAAAGQRRRARRSGDVLPGGCRTPEALADRASATSSGPNPPR